jgi:hypothetical protein
MRDVSAGRLRLVAVVVVALGLGFVIGTVRTEATIATGRADSMGQGGGSIITDDWTYGFSSDLPWTDRTNSYHENGMPNCLPPLSSVEGLRFAWVAVSVEGAGWRQVVWIDCRSAPQP